MTFRKRRCAMQDINWTRCNTVWHRTMPNPCRPLARAVSYTHLDVYKRQDWPIKKAQTEAQRLKMLVDAGTDPRELERQQQADKASQVAAALEAGRQSALTFGEAWSAYVAARKPYWGAWQYKDQLTLGDAGGVKPKRGKSATLTIARPIPPLMA